MNRLTNPTKVADLFGPGKDGYGNGVAGVTPPTILDAEAMNPLQEEIARAIEARGIALDPDDLGQLAAVLLSLSQNIVRPDCEDAVLSSANTPHDQPGSAANRWKLQLYFPLTAGGVVRFFTGEGNFGDGSCWALTLNAAWNPAPAPTYQKWSKDDTSLESNLLRAQFGELAWYGRQAGTGTWSDQEWDDQGRGNFLVGDTLTAKTLHSVQHVNAGDQLNAAGDCNVGNDVNATHSINAQDWVRAGQEFNYLTPKPRPIELFPEGGFDTFLDRTRLSSGESAIWRIRVPSGGTLGQVDFKIQEYTDCNYTYDIYRTSGINFTNTSTPTSVAVATASVSGGGTGVVVNKVLTYGGITVNNASEHYWVRVACHSGSPADIDVWAVRLTFTDPGPRNW